MNQDLKSESTLALRNTPARAPATSLLTDRITFTLTQFETKVAEFNKPMRPLETLNTQIWEDFDKEPLLLGGVIGVLVGAVATNHYRRRKHRK